MCAFITVYVDEKHIVAVGDETFLSCYLSEREVNSLFYVLRV